jgi:hypothetical protein
MNRLIRYFDLQSARRQQKAMAQAKGQPGPSLPVIPQYLALVLGIAVQPYLSAYQKSHVWDLGGWQGWLVFAFLVGLVVFPAVYKKTFDPQSPLFLQFCAIFSAGMGWQSLFATAMAVAGKNPG